MADSTAPVATGSRFARRREAARAKHLCIVCLQRAAVNSRTVCSPCNEAAKERVRASRLRKAEEAAARKALLSQESAGDVARARHAYPEALQQYEEALRAPALRSDDVRRLSEKYASALFYGHEPERAREWLERALQSYRRDGITGENAGAAGTLLLRLSRQYWLNSQTVSALPLISEAIQLGTVGDDEEFFTRANLAMAHYLILLGRHRAAGPFFRRVGEVRGSDPPEMRAVSLSQRAILFAAQGDRRLAYRSFDGAIDAARRLTDGYQITSVWDDYGIWAMALGDIKTAQFCRERALFVARERHIAWRVSYLSLRYADLLLELEEYERARDLVLDALTYDVETPCIKILAASIGTRLAMVLDDRGLLHRCTDERVLEHAFNSGEPARIGPLVSAIVRDRVARGQVEKATRLLRRALPALLSADHAWDLLVDAAVLGNEGERTAARALLASRAALPCGDVAKAYLHLYDAATARRFSQAAARHAGAQRAAEAFRGIGWLAQERYALSFLGEKCGTLSERVPRSFHTMLGGLSMLTAREAQVADLALKGHTNRSIARELSISEHTVESHMTSIMNRLGIRSRHQLVGMVADSGKALPS